MTENCTDVTHAAKRAEAHRLVDFWIGNASGSKWPTLRKEQVLAGLHARIDDPDLIEPQRANLREVASVVRELACDDPSEYALLAILLYGVGRATLRKRPSSRIEPDPQTRMAPVPIDNGKEMNHADWLMLASARDAVRATAGVNDAAEVGVEGPSGR
jgi:hypothetical protein